LVDLDIVTPYFRTREVAARLLARGVTVVSPSTIGQHLDTPALTPEILGTIEQERAPVVLDVGGDRQGARALGQFSSVIDRRGYVMHLVVNPYRPFTSTLSGLTDSLTEIEQSSRLQATSLVSNPNLMGETTSLAVIQGHALVENWSRELGLPIAFVAVDGDRLDALADHEFGQPLLTLERFFVMPGSALDGRRGHVSQRTGQ
jgi:hypothetical protein